MPIRDRAPIRFTARGLSDAFDATDTFLGACRDLQNLVFDRSNPELTVPRPGVTEMTDFPGFNTPGFVSLHFSIQPRVYGMLDTALNPGFDEPFCYDVVGGVFVPVTGATAINTPANPPTTGSWNPPTGAVIGTKIIITHPGFTGAGANFFGVIDISTFAAPAWSAQNTTVHALPGVPTCVENFNNRAYYAVGNELWFSDNLAPTVITNATQFLVIGDSSPIIKLVGLPVQTASGGMVGALLIYKEGGQIWQIRGDAVTSDLTLNPISLNIGTLSPRTCVLTPEGTYFIGTDGPYVIDTLGRLFPVRANENVVGPDITEPFRNATTPSRSCATFAGKVYRTCGDTIIQGIAIPAADYWFDTSKRRWNGRHSFPYDCASPFDTYAILSSKDAPGKLFKSQVYADVNTIFDDVGANIACLMTSASLPKTNDMSEKQVVESTIELGAFRSAGGVYNIAALDEQASQIGSFGYTPPSSGSLWGAFIWGVGIWGSAASIPSVYNINWSMPLIFQKVSLQVGFNAQAGASVGTWYLGYQALGYTNLFNP